MTTIHIDGAARGNPGPAGYGIAVSDEEGVLCEEAWGYIGEQTNNFAEYTALIAALTLAKQRGWKRLRVRSDSELMVKQMKGEYRVKNETLAVFHRRAQALKRDFESVTIEHVLRGKNKDADRLANRAVDERSSQPESINPVIATRSS